MKVKDWNKFQHYSNRRPQWIKLYNDLLNDRDWHDLKPENAKLLVNLWLVASEDWDMEGQLPDAETLAWRLRINKTKLINQLAELSHWLEQDASDVLAESDSRVLEQKSREEKRRVEESAGAREKKIPPEFDSVKSYFEEKGVDNGEASQFFDHHTARGWILTNGKQMRDWKAACRTWISNIDKFSKKEFKKPGDKEVTWV